MPLQDMRKSSPVTDSGEEYSGEYFIYDWLGLSTEATADCLDLFH